MVKQTYIERDLIDYVKGEIEAPDGSYSRRPDWVIHNLPASASVQYWREGGYNGKLAFVIRLDGYVWLFNDYYGSCSGCDAFLRNKKSYTEDMLRDAYCFPLEEAAYEYFKSTDDYSWNGLRPAIHEMIHDRKAYLKNPSTRIEFKKTEKGGEIEVTHKSAKYE